MKLAMINYCGTVGKTTLSAQLLSRKMNEPTIFAIESINQTAEALGLDVEKMNGKDFRPLLKKILLLDNVIIDIGASNVENFLQAMASYEESHEDFDYFIVPTTSGIKEQKETIAMLDDLINQGIPSEKIKLIFNRVEQDIESEFSYILKYLNTRKIKIDFAEIKESELFDLMAIKNLTIDKILNDPNDYKKMIKENPQASDKEKHEWADKYSLKALSKSVVKNLDEAFESLNLL
jgi:hypothetical protein